MANKLCQRCFHSYVCEQFNEHRDNAAEYTRCHFYNDHFVDAADVEAVKHGRWEYHDCVCTGDGLAAVYACSVCSGCIDEDVFDNLHSTNYCPNCGAKMQGGNDE